MRDVQEAPPRLEKTGALEIFAADVRQGLGSPRKTLPCKYFYDERGAVLFDRICELPEYYLTRTEMRIMERHVGEMAGAMGPQAALVELGSGSALKTRMLLDHLRDPVAYVPVDISREQLHAVAHAMAADYPHLPIAPVCADFTHRFALPRLQQRPRRWLVYFPGSTIGNFDPAEAQAFLARLRTIVGPGGGLLIGVDLKKDPAVLHAAYNDAAGITAEFNRNMLRRINRELYGTFVPVRFAHYAFYNPEQSRIEMHLVSRKRQVVSAAGRRYEFKSGESIFTESSYKHDPHEFAQLAASAGFELRGGWTDERQWFCVQLYAAG